MSALADRSHLDTGCTRLPAHRLDLRHGLLLHAYHLRWLAPGARP